MSFIFLFSFICSATGLPTLGFWPEWDCSMLYCLHYNRVHGLLGGYEAHQRPSSAGESGKERTRLGLRSGFILIFLPWEIGCVQLLYACVNRQKRVSSGETVRVGSSAAMKTLKTRTVVASITNKTQSDRGRGKTTSITWIMALKQCKIIENVLKG